MKTILVIFLSSVFSIAFSQDPHFTQYQNTRSYLNPAMAGIDSTLVLTGGYRLQWPALPGPYTNIHVAADKHITFLKGGLGVNFLYGDAGNGVIKSTGVALNYAPHFELFDHKLMVQPGIGLGYGSKKFDLTKLTFGDMIDKKWVYLRNARCCWIL